MPFMIRKRGFEPMNADKISIRRPTSLNTLPAEKVGVSPAYNLGFSSEDKVNSLPSNNSPYPGPLKLILVSSTPRSGSTFIGEVMATHPNTAYFFEPLHKMQHDPCMQNTDCVSSYIDDILSCRISANFEHWLKNKALFASFLNDQARKCYTLNSSQKSGCFSKIDLTAVCKEAEVRFTKLIRIRIEQLTSIIRSSPDVKVIHLYRDPRGFLKSIAKFKNWDHNSTAYCNGLVRDLESFGLLSLDYPDKLHHVSYEEFSQDPVSSTQALFKFAFGSSELSNGTLHYLMKHTQSSQSGPMSTFKKSSSVYQAWRNSISYDFLKKIENNVECRVAIQLINHRLFDNIENARNKNLSLFL